MLLVVMMMMMAEVVVVVPQGFSNVPSPSPQTWRSPSLPFLPRSKQFDAREHIELARLVVGALAVARAAAAAARVRLLPLPRLPLLADQGAGDSRRAGHAPPLE